MIKKNTAFIILCILNPFFAFSQTPGKVWDKIYSGNVYESTKLVLETTDHGIVTAGSSSSGIGGDKTQDNHDTSYVSFDFWIIKADSNGTLLWEKSFGGNMHEELMDIKQTTDHGFIIAGTTLSDSSGDVSQPGRGYKDYWIVKTDSVGNKQWEKRFGGDQTELLTCVAQTSDGGYLLGGSSLSNMSGDKTADNHNVNLLNFDFWIVKTDAQGIKLWDKTIGGDNYDVMEAIVLIPSGGMLLGGYSKSNTSGDKTSDSRGEADFWIVKINDNGNILWNKTIGGDYIDWLFSMTLTHDRGFALTGTSGSSDSIGERTAPSRGGWDYWVVKTDSTGNIQWNNAYGGNADEEVGNIIQTHDNGYLIGGTSYSNLSGDKTEDNFGIEQGWLVKTDSVGTLEWDRTVFTYGHDEDCYAIQTHEHCYLTCVYTEADTGGYKTFSNLYASDYWIVKFCYDGPVAAFAASDSVLCEQQCIDFFDLSTNNPVAWNWSFPGAVPSSSNSQHPTNICYATSGFYPVKLITSNLYGTDSIEAINFIQSYLLNPPMVTIHDDTLFCSPAYSYQWYLDTMAIPGATSNYYVITLPGSYSVVITDSTGCSRSSEIFTTGIDNYGKQQQLVISPNPSDGNFFLYSNLNRGEQVLLDVYNSLGVLVYSDKLFLQKGISRVSLNISNQTKGLYLLSIQMGSTNYRNKLMVK